MEALGFAAAVLMGTVLGLIGGGGSILSVPILTYLFGINPVISTGYSLFIVGTSALFGAVQYHQKRLINYRVGVVFMIPAMTGVFTARKFLVPSLPESLHLFENWTLTKDGFIMGLFAVVMILASISMIRGRSDRNAEHRPLNFLLIGIEGVLVGIITGVVGAGGGFLIIPALVVLAGLEMKVAIGTSLAIIAVKSLGGFAGEVSAQGILDWKLLILFTAFSLVGILIGSYLSNKVHGPALKKAFGYFVLIMGAAILYQQV